ncbi:MAG TPA: hypothetical protein VFV87_17285 [Pirellulaceae bacterium]|nr:hypothetical protein [Pirellulaceae bacterium]
MAESLPIIVCRVSTSDGVRDYVTCVSQEAAITRGLVPAAIIGVLLRPVDEVASITPAVFAGNRVFIDFMHGVIARRAPSLPGLVAEARRQKDGWVYVIDQRTATPLGKVPTEDIIGAFEVHGGHVVPDSYQPNPKHLILSDSGFFGLGAELQACLLEELTMEM